MGAPDAYAGEVPVAFVTFKPDLRKLASIDVLAARFAELWQAAVVRVAAPAISDGGAEGIAIQFAAGTPAALVEQCSEVVARLGLKATVVPPGAASSGSPSAACPSAACPSSPSSVA